jgi:hypothetical protein
LTAKLDTTIRNPDAIREVLKHVCYRRGSGVLVTLYAKFECNFIWLELDVMHLTANITKEDVDFSLKSPDLKVRFAHGDTVLCASVRLLGIGMVQGRKTLRMSIPEALETNDFREAYRVERVGRVVVTFSSRKYELLNGKLINISPTGARILALKEFEDGDVKVDDTIHVTIPLTPEIVIVSKAKVRNVKDQFIGVEFKPKLDSRVLEELTQWVAHKRAEALIPVEEGGKESPLVDSDQQEYLVPMGSDPIIALVGGSQELAKVLQPMLGGLPPLHRFSANVQTMKALGYIPGSLVLYFIASAEHEVRKRARLLLEPLQGKLPIMLLATTVPANKLHEMAIELKAASVYLIQPTGNVLFPRVVAGILRQQTQVRSGE